MIAVAIFPVFYFFFLKLNLFPALHLSLLLCSPFLPGLSADWAFLDFDRKVWDIIFEAIRSPSERYQNIQDNPEYNSVLPFRIILKIFAVNMLKYYNVRQGLLIFFACENKYVSSFLHLHQCTLNNYLTWKRHLNVISIGTYGTADLVLFQCRF